MICFLLIRLRCYEPKEELGENRGVTITPMDKSTDAILTLTVFTQFLLELIGSRVILKVTL